MMRYVAIEDEIPMGRLGGVFEIAETVLFLASGQGVVYNRTGDKSKRRILLMKKKLLTDVRLLMRARLRELFISLSVLFCQRRIDGIKSETDPACFTGYC